MHRALFTNWKFALLWAIGISASVAAFFADGGGHEELAANAEQIREKRGNAYREDAGEAQPIEQAAPATPPSDEAELEEPTFGEPMIDEFDGETQAAPKPAAKPSGEGEAEGEEAF
jgi:hypothetical protein